MDRYTLGRKLGEGAFGEVYFATEKATGAERAIKYIRGSYCSSWDEVKQLRELRSLSSVPPHNNVVRLYEVHRSPNNEVHFVFEYMSDGAISDLIDRRFQQKLDPIPDELGRNLLHQLLLGVKHLHSHGVVHRDIKPENVLLANQHGKLVCKVADFSIARHMSDTTPITSYVSTRWYRAPEILLSAPKYDYAVDMWAIGCIAFELYTNCALFPGKDETDQIRLVFSRLGTPESVGWSAGQQLLRSQGMDSWPAFEQQPKLCPHNAVVSDFLTKILQLDPEGRLTSANALRHHLFLGLDAGEPNAFAAPRRNIVSANNDEVGVSVSSSFTTPKPVNFADDQQRAKNFVTVSPRQWGATLTNQQLTQQLTQQLRHQQYARDGHLSGKRQSIESEPQTATDEENANPYILRKHRKKGRSV